MDIATVKKAARLSRIEITDAEAELARPKLENIMKFVEQLAEVNTDNVEPLSNVSESELRLRDDIVNDGNQQEAVLSNAPEQTAGFFVVPKIVE